MGRYVIERVLPGLTVASRERAVSVQRLQAREGGEVRSGARVSACRRPAAPDPKARVLAHEAGLRDEDPQDRAGPHAALEWAQSHRATRRHSRRPPTRTRATGTAAEDRDPRPARRCHRQPAHPHGPVHDPPTQTHHRERAEQLRRVSRRRCEQWLRRQRGCRGQRGRIRLVVVERRQATRISREIDLVVVVVVLAVSALLRRRRERRKQRWRRKRRWWWWRRRRWRRRRRRRRQRRRRRRRRRQRRRQRWQRWQRHGIGLAVVVLAPATRISREIDLVVAVVIDAVRALLQRRGRCRLGPTGGTPHEHQNESSEQQLQDPRRVVNEMCVRGAWTLSGQLTDWRGRRCCEVRRLALPSSDAPQPGMRP